MLPEYQKLFYNTTLSQTISGCGEYLFAGNNFGEIFVYSISQVCISPVEQNYDAGEGGSSMETPVTLKNSLTKPLQIFKASDNSNQHQQIQSLAFHNNFLIVGTNTGTISGYTWYKNRVTKKAWEIYLSNKNVADTQNDVNSLWLHKKEGLLYAGCGDNNIYTVNLDEGKVVRSFSGHSDYVHWVDGTAENCVYSASEDGSVKFWDRREKRSINQLEPYKDERLDRPQFGKWQGTVSATDDWLICGGGPQACLYHLRSMECTTIFPFTSAAHVSGFLDDIVYVAGDSDHLCQYNLKGDVTAEVPTSSSSVFSVVSQSSPEKLMSIGGSSNCLDICTNFNYKDVLLKLYEAPKK